MITDRNDIYLYFEWIKQTNPTSILDFGIFLQRIGAVARQVMNCEISKDIILEGISMNEEVQPVYTKIYDKIINIKSIHNLDTKIYDLIYFFDMYSEYNNTMMITKEALWNWLLNHGKMIVADTNDVDFINFMTSHVVCQAIHLEGRQYALIQGKAAENDFVAEEKDIQNDLCEEEKNIQNDLYEKGKTKQSNLYIKEHIKQDSSIKITEQSDIRLYIAAHKIFTIPDDIDLNEGMYIPLHVGRQKKPSLGFIGDDTGEHISIKNDTYCELTGMYWIWKNVSCDVVGLCHYRRYFLNNEKILNKHDVCELMNQYDIVVGNSSMSTHKNMGEYYANKHYAKDLAICKDVIRQRYPEYIQAFELCMSSNFMNIGNMMICRKNVFDVYCQWLFDILDEVEKRIDVSHYDTYQKRVYGFLGERLLRVWLVNHTFHIKELVINFCDT